MFSPVRAFKHLHHDKMLLGQDSGYVPFKCWAFLYSKLNIPVYAVPMARVFNLAKEDITDSCDIFKYELKKAAGPDEDGYYLYLLTDNPIDPTDPANY